MEKCQHSRRHKKCSRSWLCVTVQSLDETPAVLSLGELFEDHGNSYDWVGVQKPRLTIEARTITCKIDNHVPLVISTRTITDSRTRTVISGPSTGDRLRHMLEWLRETAEGLLDRVNVIWKSSTTSSRNTFFFKRRPTEKEEHTIHARISCRIQIVKSAGARELREVLAEGILKTKMANYRARQNSMISSQQITKSAVKKASRDYSIVLQWCQKIWLLNRSSPTGN